jgi:hypothetical protein
VNPDEEPGLFEAQNAINSDELKVVVRRKKGAWTYQVLLTLLGVEALAKEFAYYKHEHESALAEGYLDTDEANQFRKIISACATALNNANATLVRAGLPKVHF